MPVRIPAGEMAGFLRSLPGKDGFQSIPDAELSCLAVTLDLGVWRIQVEFVGKHTTGMAGNQFWTVD